MELIKQSSPYSCAAACLAMLTGNTEQYVLDWFEFYDPPFCIEDCMIFLAHHGVYLCTCITPIDSSDVDDKFVALVGFTKYELLIQVYTDSGFPHMIVWDGEKIIDPDPYSTKTDISEYEVEYIYPVMKTKRRIENGG